MDVPSELLLSFITITTLEIILAIDNVLFIFVVTSKLPAEKQRFTQITAISLAAFMRIVCLLGVSLIMQLNSSLFSLFDNDISIKDMILIAGGLFLIAKAIHEIILLYRPYHQKQTAGKGIITTIIQILLIDAVFSIDSIITAIALTDSLMVIITSIIVSCVIMLMASKWLIKISHSLQLKLIALTSLVFIGVMLAASGIDIKIDKGYLMTALGFAFVIFALQLTIKARKKTL
ncbi:MAG: TerC family protein [Francisellaceae bacterium]